MNQQVGALRHLFQIGGFLGIATHDDRPILVVEAVAHGGIHGLVIDGEGRDLESVLVDKDGALSCRRLGEGAREATCGPRAGRLPLRGVPMRYCWSWL